MHTRSRLLTALAVIATLVIAVGTGIPRAHASTSIVTAYAPGWNMLGAPAGTDLSFAVSLYIYNGTAYVHPGSTTAVTCQGYWAYFPVSAHLSLNGTPPTTATTTCTLQPGYTMVGNPYDVPAALPTGTTAFYWNTSTSQYDSVTSIPVGAAVWIYSNTAGSVVLQGQASAATSTSATAITFGRELGNILPYQVTIAASGATSLTGITPTTTPAITQQQVASFNAQAQSLGFFSLPASTNCAGTSPDVASRYISMTQNGATRRVEVHGDCQPAFTQLYQALAAAAGVS
ncbi:MAG: hypothetical protein ACRDFX_06215 [Chloroflexota bacterium]